MRVVFANRFFFPDESATSRMISSLAFGLADRGHSVHVVTSRQRHDGGPGFAPRETIRGVHIHRVATSDFGRARLAGRTADYLAYHLGAGLLLRRLAGPGDVVVVATDPPLFCVTASAALAGSRASVVNWMLDLFPEAAIRLGVMPPRGRGARVLCRLRDASLRRARLNVAPIGRMAELLAERGVPSGNMVVMHQWADGEAIRPIDPAQNPLRQEWGLQGKFVVGYSGNFGRVHEFGTILGAAERLRHHAEIVFLLVGGGHRRAWIEAEVRRRGLENVVLKPLQPRERVRQTLGAADVHLVSLLPDLEPCSVPSKFYGILAAGRPTLFVGDPDGEIARIIARTGCGAAVRIGEEAQLAAHILELAGPGPRSAQMAAAARQTFEAEFHEAVGIGAWQRLLQGLAAPQVRAPGHAAGVPVES